MEVKNCGVENNANQHPADPAMSSSNQIDSMKEESSVCPNKDNSSQIINDENGYDPNEQDDDLNDVLSDIEELIESAVDVDVSKYPEGASVRKKRVLEHRLTDPFSILPNGWIEITHNSGLPVYLHRSSRVCSFSRPYFLGKSSVRRHDIPASSVPCFYMRKRQAEMKAQKEQETINLPINTPTIEIRHAGDKDHYLSDDQIYDYTKDLFKFKTIDVVRFSKWSETRQFQRGKKRTHGERINEFDSIDRPGLPAETKLITVPAMNENARPSQRTMSLNPIGKSSVSLLHDFVQKVLKNTINYDFIELSNVATPYRCVANLKQANDSTKIQLHQSVESKLKVLRERYERENAYNETGKSDEKRDDKVILGIGFGRSKKESKLAAAEKILAILIPGLKFNEDHVVVADNDEMDENGDKKLKSNPEEMFEMLEIVDSRIPELCNRIAQHQPYMILKELIRRNSTMTDASLEFKSGRLKHQRHEFILTLGKIEVKVRGGNKHDGKQRAAQQMLSELYPKAKHWSDIMRLYNADSLNMQKDAQRYKRKLTSQVADELSESFAVSNESIGLELRNALNSMEDRSTSKHREIVLRPPVGYTAPKLPLDDCAHFGELCKRYAHLFPDNNLLDSIIDE